MRLLTAIFEPSAKITSAVPRLTRHRQSGLRTGSHS
jgi:hypothetical protein